MSVIERWRGRQVDGFVLTPRAHEHYCAEHDHRWRCVADPCVQFDMAPCQWLEEEHAGA